MNRARTQNNSTKSSVRIAPPPSLYLMEKKNISMRRILAPAGLWRYAPRRNKHRCAGACSEPARGREGTHKQGAQLGVIGYEQWQVTANGGTAVLPGGTVVPAKFLPYYSVHAVGGQTTFLMPEKNLALWFKYEHEYAAYSHTLGTTIVFGGSWTLRIPKPQPAK